MPANGVSRAAKIRAERKEALRELLRNQGHEQYVLESVAKLEKLDSELDAVQVQRLAKAIDTRMKLIAKYLPDDKDPQDINVGGQEENPIIQRIERLIVRPKDSNG